MKKYLFLILISCVLILTAILAGLSLEPTSYYLENKAGFFQQENDAPSVILAQEATGQEEKYRTWQLSVPLSIFLEVYPISRWCFR